MANSYFYTIQNYLLELDFDIRHQDEANNLLVVSKPELGIEHLVLGCGEPLLILEQYLLDLEREAFLSLTGERKTLERIQSILTTGKPLRN